MNAFLVVAAFKATMGVAFSLVFLVSKSCSSLDYPVLQGDLGVLWACN